MKERTYEDIDEEAESESKHEDEDEHISCPECGGRVRRDETQGETVCEDCGLVVTSENIDHGPDWRSFSEDERREKSRVGAPATEMLHDRGLSTTIGWQDKDAYGNSLSSRQRKKMKRLRTWNQRTSTKNPKERNLKQALGEIDRMASALGLPQNIRETAGTVYRRAIEEDLLRGRSIEGVSTACLYAASRMHDAPRSFDKFETVSRVEKLEIKRTYRYIARELGLEIEPTPPSQYLPQFASKLGLENEVEQKAMEILEETKGHPVRVGKNPIGIASAAIYAASLLEGVDYTQDEINEVTDISVVTIRNRYQELLEAYNTGYVSE